MRLATKVTTGSAAALLGAGVALGVVLTGGSHGTPAPVVIHQVADTAVAPPASPSTNRARTTVLKPADATAVTVDPTTTAPDPSPSTTPEPVASPTLVNVGSGTSDSGTIQPPSLPPNLVVVPLPKPQITSLPTGSAAPSH